VKELVAAALTSPRHRYGQGGEEKEGDSSAAHSSGALGLLFIGRRAESCCWASVDDKPSKEINGLRCHLGQEIELGRNWLKRIRRQNFGWIQTKFE
jgi:hypothetical protein